MIAQRLVPIGALLITISLVYISLVSQEREFLPFNIHLTFSFDDMSLC